MKIDKVVFSTSEEFSPFWNIQSYIWKEKLGIEPVCILWGDVKNTNMKDTYGEIIEKKYNRDMIKSFQLTWSKFYHPITEPDKVWMIGDIDLIPLQKNHFTSKIKDLPDDVYTHLAYDILNKGKKFQESGMLTANYHVAKGKTFIKGLGLDECSFEEQIKRVTQDEYNRFGQSTTEKHMKDHQQWTDDHGYPCFISPENDNTEISYWQADERYSTWRLRRSIGCDSSSELPGPWWVDKNSYGNSNEPLPFQKDRQIEFSSDVTLDLSFSPHGGLVDRVDRCEFRNGNYTNWNPVKLKEHGYVDMHCWRPYHEQENSMLEVLSHAWGEDVYKIIKDKQEGVLQ